MMSEYWGLLFFLVRSSSIGESMILLSWKGSESSVASSTSPRLTTVDLDAFRDSPESVTDER